MPKQHGDSKATQVTVVIKLWLRYKNLQELVLCCLFLFEIVFIIYDPCQAYI